VSDLSIHIQGVNKRFGETHAVRDLELAVPAGSLCGFLGPNGAGKSTTIRMIMSIIYPDSGSISVLGGNALDNKDRIGYLPEERGLYRKMRVGEFLEYVALLKGMPKPGLTKHINNWLEKIELPGISRKKCEELSKGMQQKIQFLVSIIHDPDLIILDEPFSGLDPVNAELLQQLIKEMHEDGKTVIFSTHVMHQAEQLCDRFFLINKGAKLLDANPLEIQQRFDPRTIIVEPLNGTLDYSAIPGVMNATPLPHSSALELELTPEQNPQEIMQRLLADHPVRRVELRRLTLEEVFIRLVRADIGEEAAVKAKEELAHV